MHDPNHYDFVVIGSGPAGQRAAIQAAKEGARVAIIERRRVEKDGKVGGVCLHAGTIPSKTLREAVLYLRGVRQRAYYGDSYVLKADISLQDLLARTGSVIDQEMEVMTNQLSRNGVDLLFGQGGFLDEHTIHIKSHDGRNDRTINADFVTVATGSRPRCPEGVPFDQEVIFDSNFIFSTRSRRQSLPKSLIVVGAGVIGAEYASVFGALGAEVHPVDRRGDMFRFCDESIVHRLRMEMEQYGVCFHFGAELGKISRTSEGKGRLELEGKAPLEADALLFTMGREACTKDLGLENTGVKTDSNGRVEVNEHYQTAVSHIYAAGDVIGFPALASTSAEQGRLAACHALGIPSLSHDELFPIAIYTIPEISMVGKTEQELKEANVPYSQGIAFYKEIAKSTMTGDHSGALKLLFHRETLRLLGVHCIGEQACETIHIGQAVMAFEGTLDYFMNNVFNYPTFAEAYKVAALNGINNLLGRATFSSLQSV